MDVGNPSNFDRMMWLYDGDLDAIRRDVVGSRHDDDEVRATIRRVYDERGYVLDPHSAIAYLGIKGCGRRGGRCGAGVFLATAHPAKFGEIVEPIIGRAVPKPAPLLDALARERHIVHVEATLDAVRAVVSPPCEACRRTSRRMSRYVYRRDVLEALLVHGVRPTERTRPGAGPRFRPRSLQVRDQEAARAIPAPRISEERVLRSRGRAAGPVSRAGADRARMGRVIGERHQ